MVHSGEIFSYDADRRTIEMFGYTCSLLTDTEAITYIIDYLKRKAGFDYEDITRIIAVPFWEETARMPEEAARRAKLLRNTYAGLLITGPFPIICGFNKGLMALNDRLKLRSMVAGEKDDLVYIASEESAIRAVCPDIEGIWAPGADIIAIDGFRGSTGAAFAAHPRGGWETGRRSHSLRRVLPALRGALLREGLHHRSAFRRGQRG